MAQELWPGGPLFNEDSDIFRLGIDSVLLAHFAKATGLRKNRRAADLGCGSGFLSVLLAWENSGLHIDAIDIQPNAAALALENAAVNGLADRITVIEGDLRCIRELLKPGVYDLVVSNPPYYTSGGGKRPAGTGAAIARSEEMCTLGDVCKAAGYLTRWGGSFVLVHKPERLAEVFRCLSENGLEPKRVRFVSHMSSSPPNLVLIEARRGGKPSLKFEAPIVLFSSDGTETDEVRAICKR